MVAQDKRLGAKLPRSEQGQRSEALQGTAEEAIPGGCGVRAAACAAHPARQVQQVRGGRFF